MLKIVHDEIKLVAFRVLEMTFYNARRDDAENISDYLAYEVLTLSELMSDNSTHDFVVKEILKSDRLSGKTKQIIRKLC